MAPELHLATTISSDDATGMHLPTDIRANLSEPNLSSQTNTTAANNMGKGNIMKFGNLVDGLLILGRYADPEEYNIGAEHDQMFIGSTDYPLTDEEKSEMRRLGFFEHEEGECWSCWT